MQQNNIDQEDQSTKPIETKASDTGSSTAETGNLKVNKKGFIEIDGQIIESLPSITFKVQLENSQQIMARLSGKMRMHKIMLLPGDKVRVEMSPYDLAKGRIVYRY